MKTNDLRTALLTDHNAAIDYIVLNNGEAVAQRLRDLGLIVNGPDDIYEGLRHLIAEGQMEEFRHALAVPMLIDSMSSDEIVVLRDVMKAHTNAAKRIRNRFTSKFRRN